MIVVVILIMLRSFLVIKLEVVIVCGSGSDYHNRKQDLSSFQLSFLVWPFAATDRGNL